RASTCTKAVTPARRRRSTARCTSRSPTAWARFAPATWCVHASTPSPTTTSPPPPSRSSRSPAPPPARPACPSSPERPSVHSHVAAVVGAGDVAVLEGGGELQEDGGGAGGDGG